MLPPLSIANCLNWALCPIPTLNADYLPIESVYIYTLVPGVHNTISCSINPSLDA